MFFVTSLRITALVDSDAGPSLSLQQCYFPHARFKKDMLYVICAESEGQRENVANKLQNNNETCFFFFYHHTTDFQFRQKQLPTFCPICPSHVVQNEKMKGGTLTTQLASPQKHPCRAHMLSGTKCRCVSSKPCHAICAPSPSVKERGGGEVRQEIIVTSLHHCQLHTQVRAEQRSIPKQPGTHS